MIRVGAASLTRARARAVSLALEAITRLRTRVHFDAYSTRVTIDG